MKMLLLYFSNICTVVKLSAKVEGKEYAYRHIFLILFSDQNIIHAHLLEQKRGKRNDII